MQGSMTLDEPLILLGKQYAKPEIGQPGDSKDCEGGCSLDVCPTSLSFRTFLAQVFRVFLVFSHSP
jgi:hypothetical protein